MSENRKFKDSEVLNNYISYMSENNPTYYDENAYYFDPKIRNEIQFIWYLDI